MCTVVGSAPEAPRRVGWVIDASGHDASAIHLPKVATTVGPIEPPAVDNQPWVGGVGRRDEDIGEADVCRRATFARHVGWQCWWRRGWC